MADKYPSTLLVDLKEKLEKISDQTVRQQIETEIRKADLDLLKKINEVQAAIFAAIGAIPLPKVYAPIPQSGAGVGQWFSAFPGSGVAAVLPAGGSWAWWEFGTNSVGAYTTAIASGLSAGGTTVGAATAGVFWTLMAWRIA